MLRNTVLLDRYKQQETGEDKDAEQPEKVGSVEGDSAY